MRAIFLSDIHLRSRRDRGYEDLMNFLGLISGERVDSAGTVSSQRLVVDCLFIAGDFFDFWFCKKDHIYPEFVEVVERLVAIQAAGVQVNLCEGNHDFYLGDYFSKSLGMNVFTDWAVLNLDDQKVLLSHGDTIDRKNRKYLLLRKVLRSSLFYRLQRRLPLSLLWKLARISSSMSKELTIASQEALVGKMQAFSLEKLQDGFDAVILGHCHRPLLREYAMGGRNKIIATLGDWGEHHSYLYYQDGHFALSSYRS